MKANLLPPALIFYTDKMDPAFGGISYGPVILIRPKYKDDVGLHMHELEHAKQFWLGLGIGHALLYKFVRRYRLWAEVQAYRKQTQYVPFLSLERAAKFLTNPKYKLGLTYEQALAAIRKV